MFTIITYIKYRVVSCLNPNKEVLYSISNSDQLRLKQEQIQQL